MLAISYSSSHSSSSSSFSSSSFFATEAQRSQSLGFFISSVLQSKNRINSRPFASFADFYPLCALCLCGKIYFRGVRRFRGQKKESIFPPLHQFATGSRWLNLK